MATQVLENSLLLNTKFFTVHISRTENAIKKRVLHYTASRNADQMAIIAEVLEHPTAG
jgi:hypothetical protein